jgi:hypothetical protein
MKRIDLSRSSGGLFADIEADLIAMLVSPLSFLPLREEAGLILEQGEFCGTVRAGSDLFLHVGTWTSR